MLFVLGYPNASGRGVLLAHVGAGLRVSVILVAAEMINLGLGVRPHDGIGRTVALGLGFGRKLTRTGWCGGRGGWYGFGRNWPCRGISRGSGVRDWPRGRRRRGSRNWGRRGRFRCWRCLRGVASTFSHIRL